ncbi:uncharacterized protein [Panulirus ornatus]|uniref:uncharacterized protein n=1 Tax=Panulirus ornatus TaxID=150431 RepID=UPI003A864EB3
MEDWQPYVPHDASLPTPPSQPQPFWTEPPGEASSASAQPYYINQPMTTPAGAFYGGYPEEAVCSGYQEEAVCSGYQEEAVCGGYPKVTVCGGYPEETVCGGYPEYPATNESQLGEWPPGVHDFYQIQTTMGGGLVSVAPVGLDDNQYSLGPPQHDTKAKRKLKEYEKPPSSDPEEERRRREAVRAKRNRDKTKQKQQLLDALQREVQQLKFQKEKRQCTIEWLEYEHGQHDSCP